MSPDRAPDTSDSRRGFAAVLLTVVLVFAQLLWPFLHAHQGPPLTSGWHLHTGTRAQGSAQGHPEPALAASSMITPQAPPQPTRPETDDVGTGAGHPARSGLAPRTRRAPPAPPGPPRDTHLVGLGRWDNIRSPEPAHHFNHSIARGHARPRSRRIPGHAPSSPGNGFFSAR